MHQQQTRLRNDDPVVQSPSPVNGLVCINPTGKPSLGVFSPGRRFFSCLTIIHDAIVLSKSQFTRYDALRCNAAPTLRVTCRDHPRNGTRSVQGAFPRRAWERVGSRQNPYPRRPKFWGQRDSMWWTPPNEFGGCYTKPTSVGFPYQIPVSTGEHFVHHMNSRRAIFRSRIYFCQQTASKSD